MSKHDVSRRSILSSTALLGTWIALDPLVEADAHEYSGKAPWTEGHEDPPRGASPGPYQFLTADEVAFIDAAVARMIPNDDLGPGAKEAGVTVFIDRQLAGPYGRAQTWYMQGPWEKGQKTQGYQYRLTPAELYRTAIKAIDDHCRETFGGKAFRDLSTDQQDDLLQKIDKEDMKLQNISGASFLTFFFRNVVEGFFSDPIYGGNRDMVGWKLIGFPGAHYDYRDYVSKHNKDLKIQPVGLKGRPEWTP